MRKCLRKGNFFTLFSFSFFCSPFFTRITKSLAEPSPLYDNHHYHEECLRCNSCAINLTGVNQKRARRFKNQILCDLHFAGAWKSQLPCLAAEQSLKVKNENFLFVDLHPSFFVIILNLFVFFADVALMECSDFMQQLRSFKPQSLGSIVARRKSSTTLIFPLPPQACSGKNKPIKL